MIITSVRTTIAEMLRRISAAHEKRFREGCIGYAVKPIEPRHPMEVHAAGQSRKNNTMNTFLTPKARKPLQ
jgi:hypothetical protein